MEMRNPTGAIEMAENTVYKVPTAIEPDAAGFGMVGGIIGAVTVHIFTQDPSIVMPIAGTLAVAGAYFGDLISRHGYACEALTRLGVSKIGDNLPLRAVMRFRKTKPVLLPALANEDTGEQFAIRSLLNGKMEIIHAIPAKPLTTWDNSIASVAMVYNLEKSTGAKQIEGNKDKASS